MTMKRIVVCDSGLGGLNIAGHFFDPQAGLDREPCELIYFNAYPEAGRGFNALPDERAQEALFRNALEGMIPFAPDLCLVACNTLSIVWERLRTYWQPPFPVAGIIDSAVDAMTEALTKEPEAGILILGTKSTAASGIYPARLEERGIGTDRIHSLGCPGLATMLESDPGAADIRVRIASHAREAHERIRPIPAKLLLGLCCTHFGFAAPIWKQEFEREFGIPVGIVDPDEHFGGNFRAGKFSYHARIELFPGARDNIGRYFAASAPAIAAALRDAKAEPGLFELTI
jgi:glutamate racemase